MAVQAGRLAGRQLRVANDAPLVAGDAVDRLSALGALCGVRVRENATSGRLDQHGRELPFAELEAGKRRPVGLTANLGGRLGCLAATREHRPVASQTGAAELCLRTQRSLARSSGRPGASTLGRFASSSQLFRASRRGKQLIESPLRHETTAADFDDGQLPKLDGAPHGQGVHAEQVSDFAIREREARVCFVGGGRRHKNLPGAGRTCATAGRRRHAGLGTRTGQQTGELQRANYAAGITVAAW